MGMARYLVEAHLLEGRPVAELAASHGVHRSWIYKLIARYRAEGDEGLVPRSRRPRRSPSRTSQAFVSEILALRKQLAKDGFDAGAQTIHTHLARKHEQVPSPSTIWRVLKAEGLVAPQPHKRPRSSYVRFCAELPNELWQSDITCWREVEIMSVIDDHSRLCVAAKAFAQVRAPDVVSTFYEAASRHGLPESLLLRQRRGLHRSAPQRALRDRVRADRARHPLQALAPLSPADLRQGGALPPDAQEAPRGAAPGSLAAAAAGTDRPLHRLLQRAAPAPVASAQDASRGLRRAHQGRPRRATVTHQRATTGSATTKSTPAAPSRCATAAACATSPWGERNKGRRVVLLVADRDVRVLSTEGEILRQLVLDPSRKYQPLG